MKTRLAIIGAGFSGISAAAYLGQAGYDVHVFEKNSEAGGRARQLRTEDGFVFDMGPSWYWMPDVFEKFFGDFGFRVRDLYELIRLDPSFEIVYGNGNTIKVPAGQEELYELFDSIERGSGDRLVKFLKEAKTKYRVAMDRLVYKPGLSIKEYFDTDILKNGTRLNLFASLSSHIRSYFSDGRLISLMEFPALFLGAKPNKTPALYSLMNYAGLALGTWYPKGGIGKVIDAMKAVAIKQGVKFHFNKPVSKILRQGDRATQIVLADGLFRVDGVIASADYHHVEECLLDESLRNYKEAYWEKRTMAPSCLLFYIGVAKRIPRLLHHTLFFDEDFELHASEIYDQPAWPTRPLFYCCCPSKSDDSIAPPGCENLFLLMPIASGLSDHESLRKKYFSIMMKRLEEFCGESIEPFIVYRNSYCINDFVADYNSYKGNAYGLANTLSQTAILKPKIRNRHLKNLFYAGQLTVPGPGVPPSIISGKVSAGLLIKEILKCENEVIVR